MLATAILAVSCFAGYGTPALEAPPRTKPVSGGEEASTCDWPTAVGITGGLCSATLIHERVMLTAGHCTPSRGSITFGESEQAPAAVVQLERCHLHPGYNRQSNSGVDIGICVLETPVNLPIVPPLMGCETDLLTHDPEVTLVGWGASYAEIAGQEWNWSTIQGAGTKRSISYSVSSFTGETILVSEPGDDGGVCPGDSGGPAMVRLPDGSWRTVGPASRIFGWTPESGDNDCDAATGVFYMVAAPFMEWIEETSGFDVTPCHDGDGTWNPGPDCISFPMDPDLGDGESWADGCGGGVVSGPSATCGDPIVDDLEAPDVRVVTPTDGETFAAPVDLTVTAQALDPAGTGVRRVGLMVDGEDIPSNAVIEIPPYAWAATFPRGSYVVSVWAEDYVGNRAVSKEVRIGVGEAPPPMPDDTDGTVDPDDPDTHDPDTDGGDAATEGETGGTDGSDGPDQGGSSSGGCGCTAIDETGVLAVLSCLLAVRRRTSNRDPRR